MTTLPLSAFPSRPALRSGSASRAGSASRDGSASRTVRPHLRLTRRGRAVVAVLIATPLALGAVAVGLGQGAAASTGTASTAASATHQFRWVTVGQDDTLWSIARRVAPTSDPRDVVADIVSLNQLPSATVDAGERIAIPDQYRG